MSGLRPRKKEKSDNHRRIISISLSINEPDEKRALDIIAAWERQGHDPKSILIPYILRLNNVEIASPRYLSIGLTQLLESIRDLREITAELKQVNISPPAASHKMSVDPGTHSTDITIDDPLVKSLMSRRKQR